MTFYFIYFLTWRSSSRLQHVYFFWMMANNKEKWEKHFDILHIALGLPTFTDIENTPNVKISVQTNDTTSINYMSLKNCCLWDDGWYTILRCDPFCCFSLLCRIGSVGEKRISLWSTESLWKCRIASSPDIFGIILWWGRVNGIKNLMC